MQRTRRPMAVLFDSPRGLGRLTSRPVKASAVSTLSWLPPFTAGVGGGRRDASSTRSSPFVFLAFLPRPLLSLSFLALGHRSPCSLLSASFALFPRRSPPSSLSSSMIILARVLFLHSRLASHSALFSFSPALLLSYPFPTLRHPGTTRRPRNLLGGVVEGCIW